jgi:hypothetical protein
MLLLRQNVLVHFRKLDPCSEVQDTTEDYEPKAEMKSKLTKASPEN